jgi:hypothetical protein
MRNFAAALTALIIVACAMPRGASAQHGGAEAYFSELKARYLRLRNTDVNITRAGEWEALSKQFENFVDQNPRYGAPRSVFTTPASAEQLYRRFGRIDRLQSARPAGAVAMEYPGTRSPMMRVKRRRHLLTTCGTSTARACYQEIVQATADGHARVAEARLQADRRRTVPRPRRPGVGAARHRRPAAGQNPLGRDRPRQGGRIWRRGAGRCWKGCVLAIALELEGLAGDAERGRKADRQWTLRSVADADGAGNTTRRMSCKLHATDRKRARASRIYYLDNTRSRAASAGEREENASVRNEARAVGTSTSC